jgi:hypothetical protein
VLLYSYLFCFCFLGQWELFILYALFVASPILDISNSTKLSIIA